MIVAVMALAPATAAASVDPTTTAVTCAPASVATGSATACTATVTDTAASGATAPTGAVAFQELGGAGAFGSGGACTLVATSSTAASCAVTFVPGSGGDYTVTGIYQTDATHDVSSGSGSVTALDPTTTAITCSPAELQAGSPTVCVATVNDGTGAEPIVGKVTFSTTPATKGAFGTPGKCTFSSTATTGVGTCPIPFTPPSAGGYTVTASYGGDSHHAASAGSTAVTSDASSASTIGLQPTPGAGGTTGLTDSASVGTVSIGATATAYVQGNAQLSVTCSGTPGAACAGTASLTLSGKTKPKHKHKKKHHRRAIDASVAASLTGGPEPYSTTAVTTVGIGTPLSAAMLTALNEAPHRTLSMTATVTVTGGTTVKTTVKVQLVGKLTTTKHKHKHKARGHKHKRSK